ncbi:hypothetical protein RCL1_007110 [Eukaryota sp. TZLM3-RCL]
MLSTSRSIKSRKGTVRSSVKLPPLIPQVVRLCPLSQSARPCATRHTFSRVLKNTINASDDVALQKAIFQSTLNKAQEGRKRAMSASSHSSALDYYKSITEDDLDLDSPKKSLSVRKSTNIVSEIMDSSKGSHVSPRPLPPSSCNRFHRWRLRSDSLNDGELLASSRSLSFADKSLSMLNSQKLVEEIIQSNLTERDSTDVSPDNSPVVENRPDFNQNKLIINDCSRDDLIDATDESQIQSIIEPRLLIDSEKDREMDLSMKEQEQKESENFKENPGPIISDSLTAEPEKNEDQYSEFPQEENPGPIISDSLTAEPEKNEDQYSEFSQEENPGPIISESPPAEPEKNEDQYSEFSQEENPGPIISESPPAEPEKNEDHHSEFSQEENPGPIISDSLTAEPEKNEDQYSEFSQEENPGPIISDSLTAEPEKNEDHHSEFSQEENPGPIISESPPAEPEKNEDQYSEFSDENLPSQNLAVEDAYASDFE